MPPPPKKDQTALTVIVLVIVALVVGGSLFAPLAFDILGKGSCRGGCGGNTPVGSVLAVGAATPSCINDTATEENCTYAFSVLAASNGVAPEDLDPVVENSTGQVQNGLADNVTAEEAGGCAISIWVFQGISGSLGQWTVPPPAQRCADLSASSALAAGDQLVLYPAATVLTSLAGPGFWLTLVGVGGKFSGEISASLA